MRISTVWLAARHARHFALAFVPAAFLVAGAPAAVAKNPPEGPHILVDVASGAVLADKDANRPWYPASTTKLMTAMVTFQAVRAGELSLKSAVTVSQHALNQPPSKMGFKVGTVLTVDNALKMIMVKSANDIAVALAEAVAGSEAMFVSRMNAEAARLGMTRTRFTNPHGLPDSGQVTTVRDMAVLARALKLGFAQYQDYFDIAAIRIGKRTLRNYNTLIRYYRGATGMKTGYICASGYNLVASARRGDRELIAVVFGAVNGVDRTETAAGLLNRGFNRGLFSGGSGKTLVNVPSGRQYTSPYDMRPHLCVRKTKAQRAAEGPRPRYREQASGLLMVDRGGKLKRSKLGRKRSLPVVRVHTGGATAVVRVAPLPRPRPAFLVAEVNGQNETVDDNMKTLRPGTVAPAVAAAFAPMPQGAGAAAAATAIAGPAVPLPRPRPK